MPKKEPNGSWTSRCGRRCCWRGSWRSKKDSYEQAADRFREAGKLGLRDKRLGPLLTLALVKAGQRLLFEKAP